MRAFGFRRSLILITALLICATKAFAQGVEPLPSSDGVGGAVVDTAPVILDGSTLFSVRGIASFPAARRAATIRNRILELASERSFNPATLEVSDDGRFTQIGPQAQPVLRITDADAELDGVDRHVLAEVYLGSIRGAILSYRAARSREALISSAWHLVLSTLLAALALVAVRFVLRVLHRWVERRYGDRVKSVSIRSFEVVKAERIWSMLRRALQLARGIALVVIAFLYLRYALTLIPWTRGAGSQVDDWVLAPLGVLGSGLVAKIPDLIFLAVLFVIVRYGLRLIRLFFLAVEHKEVELEGFDPEWSLPTFKIVRLAIVAFAVIVAYPYVPGSSSAAFKGVSLFIGVVFSLGSSSAISNVIAGYAMIYRRAFREGDVVKVGSVAGLVTQVRLQVTHLRTPKNEEIVVPNSAILGSEVINYSSLARSEGLVLHTTVGIGYETPWRQVDAMLVEAAERTPGLLKNPKPFVLHTALGDFAVTYQINVYCDDPRGMLQRYSDLHRNILDVFNEHGVQIMTPAYEGDPTEPKLVPREKWYEPPAAAEP